MSRLLISLNCQKFSLGSIVPPRAPTERGLPLYSCTPSTTAAAAKSAEGPRRAERTRTSPASTVRISPSVEPYLEPAVLGQPDRGPGEGDAPPGTSTTMSEPMVAQALATLCRGQKTGHAPTRRSAHRAARRMRPARKGPRAQATARPSTSSDVAWATGSSSERWDTFTPIPTTTASRPSTSQRIPAILRAKPHPGTRPTPSDSTTTSFGHLSRAFDAEPRQARGRRRAPSSIGTQTNRRARHFGSQARCSW